MKKTETTVNTYEEADCGMQKHDPKEKKQGEEKITQENRVKSNGKIAGQGTKKDSVTTLLFKNSNENFAELFNRNLLKDTPVSPEELVEEDIKETAFLRITKEGGGTTLVQYRDTAKGAKNSRLFAILGIENQSESDPSMVYRTIELDFVNYARQIQKIRETHRKEWTDENGHMHKPDGVSEAEYLARFLETDKIEKCMTLVVYWGEKPWKGALKFSDLFTGGMDGAHTIQMDLNLLDVRRMTEEEILGYTSELRTVFGFLKYAEDKDKLNEFMNNNENYFNRVSESALNVLDELTHLPVLLEIRKPKSRKEGEVNMKDGLRGIIDDAVEEAVKEAVKEVELRAEKEAKEADKNGEARGRAETLFDLVKDGILTISDAAKRANMSVNDFEKGYRTFLL